MVAMTQNQSPRGPKPWPTCHLGVSPPGVAHGALLASSFYLPSVAQGSLLSTGAAGQDPLGLEVSPLALSLVPSAP